jgi:hypothetical protein
MRPVRRVAELGSFGDINTAFRFLRSSGGIRVAINNSHRTTKSTTHTMMSPSEAIGIVFFFLAIASGIGMRLARNRTSTLVIQTFHIAVKPQATQNPAVEIVGRVQGVVAYALSLLGFSPITRFTIAGTELRCQSSSLFGQRSQFIPLRCVSTMAAGIHKPIATLVWAALFVLLGFYISFAMGSWAPIAIALLFGIACVVSYILSKKFFVEVYSQGGPPISLLFKPNVLEGVPIDVEQALAVVGVIRDMIINEGAAARPRQGFVANEPQTAADETSDDPPNWAVSPSAPNDAAHWVSPNISQENTDEDDEEQAKQLMAQARQHVQAGQKQLAINALQEIARRFPNTHVAEQARRNLQKSGIPT